MTRVRILIVALFLVAAGALYTGERSTEAAVDLPVTTGSVAADGLYCYGYNYGLLANYLTLLNYGYGYYYGGYYYDYDLAYGDCGTYYDCGVNLCAVACSIVFCGQTCEALNALYAELRLPFVCPGPPANIDVQPNPNSTVCGSNVNVTAIVTDVNGFRVADGTLVELSTNLGTVITNRETDGGTAVASLIIPPRTSGVATVTLRSGAAFATKDIFVSC